MNKSAKTAKARTKMSAPMKWLLENGHLRKGHMLDYGCGRGEDVRELWEKYENSHPNDEFVPGPIYGFDPNQPESTWEGDPRFSTEMITADVPFKTVTCIYVLNVIEDPKERLAVEKKIMDMVPVHGRAYIVVRDDLKGDGKTSTGTWQGLVEPQDERWFKVYHRKNKFRVYMYHKQLGE